MQQLPLFDLSTIPRRSKKACYLRGYAPRVIELLPIWDALLDDQPYRVVALSPDLLRPTQRTINRKIVAYYRNTRRGRDHNGALPTVIHAQGVYWIIDGQHRWTAFQDQPRIRVRVYELPTGDGL
jgi:hypothetical protein